MTNDEARSISVSLDFLNAGQSYRARIMTDGEDADVNPESVVLRQEAVSQEDTIELNLQPSGGGAVILEPID
jgi:alpha-glucosidase